MIRRSTLSLGAALLALACGGCQPASQPVDEATAAPTTATPPAPAAAPATAASAPAPKAVPSPTAQPAPPSEEIAMAESKTATAPPPPTGAPVPGDASEVRRISIEEANALRESGRGVILDVRDDASYAANHIAGALHIPLASLAQRLGELPRDKPIVTYCA